MAGQKISRATMASYLILRVASSDDDAIESPVLNSLQKLLWGICDPRMTAAMLEEEEKGDIDISDWQNNTRLRELQATTSNFPLTRMTPKPIDTKEATTNGTPETMDSTTNETSTVHSSFTPDTEIASFDDQGNAEVVLSLPASPKIDEIEISMEPSPSDELLPYTAASSSTTTTTIASSSDAKANKNIGLETNPELNTILSICSILDPEIDAFTGACAQDCHDVNAKVGEGIDAENNNLVAHVESNNTRNDTSSRSTTTSSSSSSIPNPATDNILVSNTKMMTDAQSSNSDQATLETLIQTDSDTTDTNDGDLVLLRKMLFPIAGVSKDDDNDNEEETNKATKIVTSKEEQKQVSSSSESENPSKKESRSLVSAPLIRRALIFTVVNTVISVAIWNAGSYYMTRSNEQKSTSRDKAT